MNLFIVGDYLYRGDMQTRVARVRRSNIRKNIFTLIRH